MNNKSRIGILGGGGILGAHAPGFQAVQDIAEVTAVAEPNPKQAERIRSLVGSDVRIYSGYQELLDDAPVDAVDILLPHDLHVSATEAAARAGKPVLIEKVMARTVEECDRMIDACEEAGVTLTVCHDRRYHAQWMALKEIVDSGVLGMPHYWRSGGDHMERKVWGNHLQWLRPGRNWELERSRAMYPRMGQEPTR